MTVTHEELTTLRTELFRDNAYRAERVFRPDQLWLDVGCHVGLFTTLAEAHGATVLGGVDANSVMVDAYMDRHPMRAVQRCITNADSIVEAAVSFGGEAMWLNALKLDIQGSEVAMLTNVRCATILSLQFPTLLFEYHDPTTLLPALMVLEAAGYDIDYVDATTDALTHQPTHIVHARRPDERVQ